MKYELLALDLDGTLLRRDSTISEENREAVEYAKRRGVQIVICTGRSYIEANQFQTQLISPSDWIISCNGTKICKPNEEENLFDAALMRQECEQILQICKKFDAKPQFLADAEIYSDLEVEKSFRLYCEKNKHVEVSPAKTICLQTMDEWESLLDARNKFSKAILYHEDPKVFDAMLQALTKLDCFELSPAAYPGSEYINVEICSKGIHKGAALKRLADHLGYGMEHVMAIGDSSNDLQMIQMSGLGIAMGNAPEEIKQQAFDCTATNAEHGVAKAIRKYL